MSINTDPKMIQKMMSFVPKVYNNKKEALEDVKKYSDMIKELSDILTQVQFRKMPVDKKFKLLQEIESQSKLRKSQLSNAIEWYNRYQK